MRTKLEVLTEILEMMTKLQTSCLGSHDSASLAGLGLILAFDKDKAR